MAIPNKIHMRVGVNEFDAEGTDEVVKHMFEAWRELVSSQPVLPKPMAVTEPVASRLSKAVGEVKANDGYTYATWDIFTCDEKKKMLSLRVNPNGEDRDADAILLVLYGFKQTWQMDEVLVGKVKESLAISGLRPERIDRTASAYIRQGYLLKTGRGPGGKYRITNTGFERADKLARNLFEQLV